MAAFSLVLQETQVEPFPVEPRERLHASCHQIQRD